MSQPNVNSHVAATTVHCMWAVWKSSLLSSLSCPWTLFFFFHCCLREWVSCLVWNSRRIPQQRTADNRASPRSSWGAWMTHVCRDAAQWLIPARFIQTALLLIKWHQRAPVEPVGFANSLLQPKKEIKYRHYGMCQNFGLIAPLFLGACWYHIIGWGGRMCVGEREHVWTVCCCGFIMQKGDIMCLHKWMLIQYFRMQSGNMLLSGDCAEVCYISYNIIL